MPMGDERIYPDLRGNSGDWGRRREAFVLNGILSRIPSLVLWNTPPPTQGLREGGHLYLEGVKGECVLGRGSGHPSDAWRCAWCGRGRVGEAEGTDGLPGCSYSGQTTRLWAASHLVGAGNFLAPMHGPKGTGDGG